VALLDGQLQILQPSQPDNPTRLNLDTFNFPIAEQPQITWPSVIGAYGVLRPGISYISLENPWVPDSPVIGTIAVNPADDRLLIFNINIDTAPQNTLDPIDSIVNPLLTGPGQGLPASAIGQRYLLTESTGDSANPTNPTAWLGTYGQPLIASVNDIIEYDGTRWAVAFNSRGSQDAQYVFNINTGIQYYWDGSRWAKSIDGFYAGGEWNLIL
jgi:hypothetical protein